MRGRLAIYNIVKVFTKYCTIDTLEQHEANQSCVCDGDKQACITEDAVLCAKKLVIMTQWDKKVT